MKVLIASTPATGHINPMFSLGRILVNAGHQVVGMSVNAMRDRIEESGATFRPFPLGADLDFRDVDAVFPERKNLERGFIEPLTAQYEGLKAVLDDFRPMSSLATICSSAYCRWCLAPDRTVRPSYCAAHRSCTAVGTMARRISLACRRRATTRTVRNTQRSRKRTMRPSITQRAENLGQSFGEAGGWAVASADCRRHGHTARSLSAAIGSEFRISAPRDAGQRALRRNTPNYSEPGADSVVGG
jgi:hypothetical protein